MERTIPPYYVINWDFNHDNLVYYDVMPYLVKCWDEETSRLHKLWNFKYDSDDSFDDTKMPETFDEFKKFIKNHAQYQFWSRCEYEVIVADWPVKNNEHKLDVYEQIEMNIDVITKHFMDYIMN